MSSHSLLRPFYDTGATVFTKDPFYGRLLTCDYLSWCGRKSVRDGPWQMVDSVLVSFDSTAHVQTSRREKYRVLSIKSVCVFKTNSLIIASNI